MESSASVMSPSIGMGQDAAGLSAGLRSKDPRSVASTAVNFESMFLSLLLKEMRQGIGEGGLFAEDHSDVQGGLFDYYLGQHLAQAGGFGIAALVKRQLSRPEGP